MNDTQDLQLASEPKEMQEQKLIHIDTRGFLSLFRKSRYESCFCPYASKNMTIRCGTWCPMFCEPVLLTGGEVALRLACVPGTFNIIGTMEDDRT